MSAKRHSRYADQRWLTRVAVRNYRSIAACDVRPPPLSVLVGPNGSGKSNFLDALRFVADALRRSLGDALLYRGGINDVLYRFGTRTAEFRYSSRRSIGRCLRPLLFLRGNEGARGGYAVRRETCLIDPDDGASPQYYEVEQGRVVNSSIRYPPVGTSDRLYLVPVSSLPQLKKMEVTSPASLPIWRRVLRSAKRSSRSTWQFLLDLILLDANSDCPRELAPNVLERAQAARSDHRIQVVLAKMEYEAWFLAVADSLAGLRGIGDDAQAPDDP